MQIIFAKKKKTLPVEERFSMIDEIYLLWITYHRVHASAEHR